MIKAWTVPVILVFAAGLAGCDENGEFLLASPPGGEAAGTEAAGAAVAAGQVVERDVEAPEVFAADEAGLWDGRPSLGGVWVAHPDVAEPERVLIRNPTNGNEVIGALFRRERDNPGPRIQVSSDAAAELGMLAGQPVELSVVALRREQVEIAPPPAPAAEDAGEAPASLASEDISTQPLDPIAAAAAAIDEAEAGAANAVAASTASAETPAAPAPSAPSAAAPASPLDKPYVQIGIFSVEANANNTAASLRNAGIVPTVLRQESRGKEFWRVIVGPATTSQDRAAILRKVKDLGFADAYYVTS